MDISINGKPADIIPEQEKTLGEILSGIEQWFTGTGHRVSGLRVNGETIGSAALPGAFDLGLEDITTLEIYTSTWPELAAEALAATREALEDLGELPFENRQRIRESWEESAAAHFLSGELPDIFALAARTFRGEGPGITELSGGLDERLREIGDPWGELYRMETLVSGVTARLEELPLDIQTGKDGRAAETVQLFSWAAEKIFRLLRFLQWDGCPVDSLSVEELPVSGFIEEFGAALKELLAAYETRDTVLVGDLAEYEMAPRLRKLYGVLKNSAAVSA